MRVIELLNPIKSMKVDEGTYPYLEISDIDVASKKYSFKDKTSVSGAVYAYLNNILVSTVRPTRGAITVVNDEKIAVSNAFAILNVNDKICLPKYLFYSLNSNIFLNCLGKNSKGATYPTCSKEDVYNYDIKYVEYTKQIEIVTVLNNVSRQIEIKREQLLEYDQLIKSRFVEMFGDQVKNPFRWSIKTIGETCKLKSGNTLPLDLENEGGAIPYIKVGDMNMIGNEKYITNSSRFVSLKTAGKGIFDVGTVIFPKRGGAIGTNKKRMTISPICADLNVMGVTPLEVINSHYLLAYFDEIDLGSLNNGSSVPQINNIDIAPLKICVPPIELQNEFSDFVQQVDKLKFEVQKSLNETQTLFDSLMQEYFG